MSNPILLSENKDYRYYGVPSKKDRTDFSISEAGNLFSKDQQITCDIDLRGAEIIGILGKDSEVSEEILSELGYNALTVDGKIFTHPSEALEYDLKLKGILIDNPIEKPKAQIYDLHPGGCGMKDFREDYEQWQSHEDKLQKVVLIKVKK